MSERAPWLLVGLGNPGREYAGNRHNVGFMAVERWLDRHWPPGIGDPWREKFHGRYAQASGSFGRCIVLQPQTYMNKSGKSVLAAAQFYRVPPQQTIVLYDEIDFEFGRLAIKKGGGHGGHNGIRDIIACLPSKDFLRIRLGVGRPVKGNNVSKWVLSDFAGSDLAELPDLLDRAEAAASTIMDKGLAAAMNAFNQAPKPPEKPPKGSKAPESADAPEPPADELSD